MVGVLFGVALVAAGPAAAEVLEIGADGAVQRHRGPERITADAREPLRPVLAATTPQAAPLLQVIEMAAARTGLHPRLLEAVAWTESRHDPTARSPKGARGVMQLMPGTARDLGVDPDDPTQNVLGGALYLRAQLDSFGGDLIKALAAYNAGPGAVRRHGGLPPYPETRDYVTRVLARLSGKNP